MEYPVTAELISFDVPLTRARSYWIVLVYTKTNGQSEALLKEMDFWTNHIVKREARALGLETPDGNYFSFYSKKFGTNACPEIIISADVSFSEYVKIGHQLITRLMENPKAFQEFCIRIHTMITSGTTVKMIERNLKAKAFWRGLNIVYKEVKSLVSFSVQFGNK